MMKSGGVLAKNVTGAEFLDLQMDLTIEDFEVTPTGVDSFTAIFGIVKGSYNRNQQTLALDFAYSDWIKESEEDTIKEKLLTIAKKEDVSEEVNRVPVMTPVDKHGNLVPQEPVEIKEEGPVVEGEAENTEPVSSVGVDPSETRGQNEGEAQEGQDSQEANSGV
jgi:hypothetical protein